jgi:hypothetical protein
MTKPEMNRRLSAIPQNDLEQAHRMVLEGWGGHGISCETGLTLKQATGLTLKQANAVFAWVERYGRVVPTNEVAA